MIKELVFHPHGAGLHEITDEIEKVVQSSGLDEGLCTLFIPHASASLLITENADPTARSDLERWFTRLVDENDPLFTHTLEGPDDMPSHVRSALTAVNLSVPVLRGRLALGKWQGIFLFEHRHAPRRRQVLVHLAA